MNERRRVKPHEKDVICFSEVRVEPSHPLKRLVASWSVASAFTSEQQRRSATFFGEETQRKSAPVTFTKKVAASDMQLILGVPAKPPALRGKEEQRRERALIFIKNRSKRYKACSDVVRVAIQDLWRSPKTKPEPSHSGSGLERRSGGVSAL